MVEDLLSQLIPQGRSQDYLGFSGAKTKTNIQVDGRRIY